jgi:DNA-directed RNA polymerase subunit beta
MSAYKEDITKMDHKDLEVHIPYRLESEQQNKKIEPNLNNLTCIEYSLDNFHRSNQDTCLVHKPSVFEGQWVQKGDLLADCSASVGGELALGQNILIGYMPWEGYNFEDAILVSERLVYDDVYTSVHIERYQVELRETKLGFEEITREIPDVHQASIQHLNSLGIAKIGSWVEQGDILVGKVTPINKKAQSNYQKLLYTILDKTVLPIRDSSLRAPKGIKAKVIGIQIFKNNKNNVIYDKNVKKLKKILKPTLPSCPPRRVKSLDEKYVIKKNLPLLHTAGITDLEELSIDKSLRKKNLNMQWIFKKGRIRKFQFNLKPKLMLRPRRTSIRGGLLYRWRSILGRVWPSLHGTPRGVEIGQKGAPPRLSRDTGGGGGLYNFKKKLYMAAGDSSTCIYPIGVDAGTDIQVFTRESAEPGRVGSQTRPRKKRNLKKPRGGYRINTGDFVVQSGVALPQERTPSMRDTLTDPFLKKKSEEFYESQYKVYKFQSEIYNQNSILINHNKFKFFSFTFQQKPKCLDIIKLNKISTCIYPYRVNAGTLSTLFSFSFSHLIPGISLRNFDNFNLKKIFYNLDFLRNFLTHNHRIKSKVDRKKSLVFVSSLFKKKKVIPLASRKGICIYPAAIYNFKKKLYMAAGGEAPRGGLGVDAGIPTGCPPQIQGKSGEASIYTPPYGGGDAPSPPRPKGSGVGGGLSIYNFKKKLYMAAGNATPRFFHRGLDLQARNLFNSRKDSNDFRYAMEKYQGNFQTTSKITLKKNLKDVSSIQIYLAEKRRIQVGDKMSGRHGNKGIISQVLPIEDMPFLPDGKPLDMVLNPLGVPSRMNVGQIYECLLGLAGKYLGENFKVFPFDEIYGAEASRSFVFSKLYSARLKTGKQWLFNQNSPGKIRLYDGRTGETFDQAITVGYSYMLRLVHMVDDKIHARSTGPYSLVTQQPLRGRSKQGGQRLGEMEVWALEGYGAAFTLLEMLTIKSDDMTGRMTLWSNLILNKEISIGTPESFKVLICELQALCLDIGLFKVNSKNI